MNTWYIYGNGNRRLISKRQLVGFTCLGEHYDETESAGLAYADWYASKYSHTILSIQSVPHLILADVWEVIYDKM